MTDNDTAFQDSCFQEALMSSSLKKKHTFDGHHIYKEAWRYQ